MTPFAAAARPGRPRAVRVAGDGMWRAGDRLQAERLATPVERLAGPPGPAGRAGAAIVLTALAGFAAVGVTSDGFTRVPWQAVAAAAALHLLARWVRSAPAAHATLLVGLAGLAALTDGFGAHPFPLVGALCAYAFLVATSPSALLRASGDWLHGGTAGPATRRAVLALGLLPVAGVPLWRLLEGPQQELGIWATMLSTQRGWDPGAGVPGFGDLSLLVLPLVILFASLVNAGAEELAFRGVLLDAAWSAVGLRAALVVQAVVFGLVHGGSVLGGVWGVLLSGAYGYLLGLLRVHAAGLAAPWAAHVLANLALFTWLAVWSR